MSAPAAPTRENRRAREAVAALFLTNGALFANMAPRLPEFKAQLGLEAGAYGLLVTAWPVGAIIAGLAAGSLIRRFGSAAVFGTLATGLAVLGAGSAGSLALVAAAFVVGGAMDAITDVAQNAHGLEVQRRYGRPILNSFHALWSVGAMLGGLMAAGAMALGLPLGVHFAISWLIFAAVALTAWKFCLPARGPVEPVEEHSVAAEPVPAASCARITVVIAALVLIASAGIMVEDAGNSWATLYLGSLGAPSALAASGYIALVGAQFIGRILGGLDGALLRPAAYRAARRGAGGRRHGPGAGLPEHSRQPAGLRRRRVRGGHAGAGCHGAGRPDSGPGPGHRAEHRLLADTAGLLAFPAAGGIHRAELLAARGPAGGADRRADRAALLVGAARTPTRRSMSSASRLTATA